MIISDFLNVVFCAFLDAVYHPYIYTWLVICIFISPPFYSYQLSLHGQSSSFSSCVLILASPHFSSEFFFASSPRFLFVARRVSSRSSASSSRSSASYFGYSASLSRRSSNSFFISSAFSSRSSALPRRLPSSSPGVFIPSNLKQCFLQSWQNFNESDLTIQML